MPASDGKTERAHLDTAAVDCPVGPKRGDATIRIDSTDQEWTITAVKPDSQFKDERGRSSVDWNELELASRGDINQDGRMDTVVEVQFATSRPVPGYHHWVFTGCGEDRYVPVTPIVRLERDSLQRRMRVETAWPDLTALENIKAETQKQTDPEFHYYHLTYRFDEEKEKYRPVPGSARYRKESAKRLGIDPDNRPRCAVGKGPPIRIRPVGETERPLQPGDSVQIKPMRPPNIYEVEWGGDLNTDGRRDLIINTGCGAGACEYKAYYPCKSKHIWYSMLLDSEYVEKIRVREEIYNGWRLISMGRGVNIWTLEFGGTKYVNRDQ